MRTPWNVGGPAEAASALLDPVATIRPTLEGAGVLVIGGDRRPEALARLRETFRLRASLWATTRDTDPSPARFRYLIADARVNIVVLPEGLVRHQHARDVVGLCKQHDKRLVRLWRSPNPVALAHALMEQAGMRLGLTSDVH